MVPVSHQQPVIGIPVGSEVADVRHARPSAGAEPPRRASAGPRGQSQAALQPGDVRAVAAETVCSVRPAAGRHDELNESFNESSVAMSVKYVDRFDNGNWITVPSVEIEGFTSIITGRWIKQAILDAEDCNERELPDPRAFIEQLQQHRRNGFAADIFTFAQKLPYTARKYSYAMEGESIAAIRLTTFTDWWDGLPQESRKNVRRAAKRGVEIRTAAVDDDLVRAIVDINNETPIRQGRRFTHYGESFDHVKRDFLAFSDRSDLLCAYVGSELIGLAKVIYCGEIAAIMKLQTKISHADKRPANA